MSNLKPTTQQRGWFVIDGAMALIAILLIVQVWLLSATLEAFLAGHTGPALPAAIFSGLLFSACFALNTFIDRRDRSSKRG
jgi:hypothetical protein